MNRRSFLKTIAGALAALVASCDAVAVANRRTATRAGAEQLAAVAVPPAFVLGTVEGPLAGSPGVYAVVVATIDKGDIRPTGHRLIARNLDEVGSTCNATHAVRVGSAVMVYEWDGRHFFHQPISAIAEVRSGS